jgi:hypothetical protein
MPVAVQLHRSLDFQSAPPSRGVGYWVLNESEASMTANDFRRIALSLEGTEEGSHMGSPDFRVGGRIFATLASEDQGYGNLMLTPEQQAAFVEELPEVFVPIAGGWGRMGMTHIQLAAANREVLAGALRTAWKLRLEKNARSSQKKRAPAEGIQIAKTRRKKR